MKTKLQVLAVQFARVDARERKLRDQRKAMGEFLMKRIKRSGATSIDIGRGRVVQLEVSRSKTPTKGDIVLAFGEAGETFWAGLATSVSEYLSVAIAKKAKARKAS